MYNIAQEEINSVNGLGANGNFTNFLQNGGMELINAGLNTVTSITNNAVNARNNQNPNPYTGGNTYTPTVYQGVNTQPVTTTTGNTNNAAQSKSIGDYLPWIIGGLALLGGAYFMMNNKGGRRR